MTKLYRDNMAAALAAVAFLCIATAATAAPADGPSVVKIVQTPNGFGLVRNGEPYFIKGAGGPGSRAELKDYGGNSIRTWGVNSEDAELAESQKLGLTVTLGIWLGHTDAGFSYHDPKQVQDQFDAAKSAVLHYKNSPALLLWGLGNEMEGPGDDPDIWRAVEDIAKMVHKLDPNHPTMTVVAEITPKKIAAINAYCPDVDIIGINSYAGLQSIPQRYHDAGGVKPYVITEFGTPGTWEWQKTTWGSLQEPTSTEKAQWYHDGYVKAIEDQPFCLGSYAFEWGNKTEATATWFGMMLADGTKLAALDTMSTLWTGKQPKALAPTIASYKLDGTDQVPAGATITASLGASDPQGDPLKVDWVLQYDPVQYHTGGAAEASPPTFPEAIVHADQSSATVKMPKFNGAYRLYAYIRDQHGEGAVANVPVLVSGGVDMPKQPNKRASLPFALYGEGAAENLPYADSGYMGNSGAVTVDEHSGDNPHSGTSCIKVTYRAADNWAGVVWQDPPNDWGDLPGGWNIAGATKLTFWARGAVGGESIQVKMGIINPPAKFPDSASAQTQINLTPQWTEYSIDLAGKDLSQIKTPFAWVVATPGHPITFYLDDIAYE